MPDSNAAAVSVVAANRTASPGLLDALARQSVAAFEVVLVGAAPAGVPEILDVRVVDAGTADPAAARNLGWRAARGSAIAFIDGDCEPAPDWIERLVEAAAGRETVVVQGRTLPAVSERAGAFAETREVTRLTPHFWANNLLYPRALLERLDGFDEAYGAAIGSDTDLAWRARAEGADIEYAPDALVHHPVDTRGAGPAIKAALAAGERVKVFGDHPQLRSELDRGIFLAPSHALIAQAALGVWLARRKRAALLFTVPYLAHVARRAHVAGAPEAAPMLVAHDALELAATIAGAIRHRTPVI
ncbi:glycosyltransferase [Solirubrobacter taibaiensis]|nr:glycosyltransferase [Solirubrobacter taibaiensis]